MRDRGSCVVEGNVCVVGLSSARLMIRRGAFLQQGSPFPGQTPVADDGVPTTRQKPEIERPMCCIGGDAAVTADPAAEEHRDRRLDQSFTPSDSNSVCSSTSTLCKAFESKRAVRRGLTASVASRPRRQDLAGDFGRNGSRHSDVQALRINHLTVVSGRDRGGAQLAQSSHSSRLGEKRESIV